MMRVMMEQPEHSSACAFETFTNFVRMIIQQKTRFGVSSVKRVNNLWINLAPVVCAAQCGPITCVWRTLLALVTDMYGDTYSMVGDVVVRIVFNLSRVH